LPPINDLVTVYFEGKIFPPKTSYDEVEKWLDLKFRGICAKIKEINNTVLEKMKEHPKKNWFKEHEYLFKYI
jgi:hypothetical protein